AHPWVDAHSAMGRGFDRLEFVEAPPKRGHAEAAEVVDRALTLWEARSRERPTFLYVHLLDVHSPRWLPNKHPRFLPADTQSHSRFGADGEPRFGEDRRRWEFTDARDFTQDDRTIYGAFYDTLLHNADQELGRLLGQLRKDDPGLAHTLIVVLADHGEQLG